VIIKLGKAIEWANEQHIFFLSDFYSITHIYLNSSVILLRLLFPGKRIKFKAVYKNFQRLTALTTVDSIEGGIQGAY